MKLLRIRWCVAAVSLCILFASVWCVVQAKDSSERVQASVGVYFSLDGECANAVQSTLDESRTSLYVCMYSLTDNRLRDALIGAMKRGVIVRVLMDNLQAKGNGSDAWALQDAGIDVRLYTKSTLHHKFAISDATTVLTGSFNWTENADKNNAENLVILDSKELAKSFLDEFTRLWNASSQGVAVDVETPAVKPQPREVSAPTVYITKTGTKYHRVSCKHLAESSMEIPLKHARAQGYVPCEDCTPERGR